MAKALSELTLEELWRLFPIRLTAHQACWKDWYAAEERRLAQVLCSIAPKRIRHIGSTSLETIWAKPIVDILVEIGPECGMQEVRALLECNGYLCMSQGERRLSFNRGYTENGFSERVFHLHLRDMGDCDEIYFRDYLAAHPEVAKAYERLKLQLWKEYAFDRDGYTNAKTAFIAKYTAEAKAHMRRGEGPSQHAIEP